MQDLYQAHTIIRTGSDILAMFFHCLDFILPICDRLNLAIFKNNQHNELMWANWTVKNQQLKMKVMSTTVNFKLLS